MNRGEGPDRLFARLAGPGLARGPMVGPFDGLAVEVWLRDGEPAVAVLAVGDEGDLEGLHRIAWSLGCPVALAPRQGRVVLIRTDDPPHDRISSNGQESAPRHIAAVPAPVPGVVHALVRLAGTWRERLLRQCLAGHHDWTEDDLNRAVEAPIVGMLLGTADENAVSARMHAELGSLGVVVGAVPPGLLALAWDLHLARGIRLVGADASIGLRPPVGRAGVERSVLRRFGSWAMEGNRVHRVFVPACGAGRLLLTCGDRAVAHNIHLYAIDPDPRAVLFAAALVEREFGGRLACTLRAAHPLIDIDMYADPLARLIPVDARARLRSVDWSSLFGGIDRFDRVLIANPSVPLTRRTAVQRYVEGRYSTAGTGANPALLLVEAGVRHLTPEGRIFALYPAAAFRVPSAASFRRWLAPRADVLIGMPGYCAVRAAAEPLSAPILAGRFGEGALALRPHQRSALDTGSWTLADPARAALLARLEVGAAPLGTVLLGGVREPAPVALDPAFVIDAHTRRRLLRADRRAASGIRPLIMPADILRFASARDVSRFAVTGPLPPRARRLALELDIEPSESELLPPPLGPRLFFSEGARIAAFLYDPLGRAVPTAGVGTIAPADPFLSGLLHSAAMATLLSERCPDGLSARCLARLPIRLPDPYDERERRIGDNIGVLSLERIALSGSEGPGAEDRRREIEAEIDSAVERLYSLSPK